MIQFCKYVFDWTLEAKTIKWFKNDNNDEQKRELILCLQGIMLMCNMASAAEEFNTASLLPMNTTVNMLKEEYETALAAAAAEFYDLRKLRVRSKPIDSKSRYFSGKAAAAQKKQRSAGLDRPKNGGGTQPTNGGQNHQKRDGTADAQADSWSTWTEESAIFNANRRNARAFNVEESKKKGAFICKPPFDQPLTPELSKKCCGKVLVYGKFCDPTKRNCTKTHVPFYRFQQAEKTDQYEYVLGNMENVRINKLDAPNNLPEKYAHLLKVPNTGAN